MNAGILYYQAHKTMHCKEQIQKTLSPFGITIAETKICIRKEDLNSCMSKLLHTVPFVLTVSSTPGYRPDCAPLLFHTLRIPLDKKGEPKGVLRLHGIDKTGYLIESIDQAIAVLPDLPEEILQMLPGSFERLSLKFGLTAPAPKEDREPFTVRLENSMNQA
ncbi:MAG: hypothetical protein GX485_03280 [Clostridiales bacterium]|jgi:hypothetical protein|nr:hypothetical protein [Clostridiales bacterium]